METLDDLRCRCCLSISCMVKDPHKFRPISFEEAVGILKNHPRFSEVDLGAGPSQEHSARATDNRWSLLTEGDEFIAYVWVDESGVAVLD